MQMVRNTRGSRYIIDDSSRICGDWQVCGRDWGRLQEAVPKKTMTQIKNYYQNYKLKVGLSTATHTP